MESPLIRKGAHPVSIPGAARFVKNVLNSLFSGSLLNEIFSGMSSY
jgi:hypothetical protein